MASEQKSLKIIETKSLTDNRKKQKNWKYGFLSALVKEPGIML